MLDPDIRAIRAMPSYADSYVGAPLVTVSIPTYNRAEILCGRTLPTVMAQTYRNWEAVVVGDGCTDDTGERIARFGDPRIRWHNRPVNGPYPSDPVNRRRVAGTFPANDTLELARGGWIAPLDDDDEWTSNHIETLLSTALRSRAEMVYGRLTVALEGSPVRTWLGNWPPRLGDFAMQGAMYHSGLRGFRYDLEVWRRDLPGDWDLAQRMLDAGVVFCFAEELVGTYNVRAANIAGWFKVAAERGTVPGNVI